MRYELDICPRLCVSVVMGTVLKALLSHFRDEEMEVQRDLHKLSLCGIAGLYFYFAFPADLAPSVSPSFMNLHHWLLTSCQGETGVAWQGSIRVVITHWPSTPVHRTWEKVPFQPPGTEALSALTTPNFSQFSSQLILVPFSSLSVFLKSFRRMHFQVLRKLIWLGFLLPFFTRAE